MLRHQLRLSTATCLLCCGSLAAQDVGESEARIYYEGRLHHGFIIVHSQDIRAVEDSYPWGMEVDMGWQKFGAKPWNTCNCIPRLGFSLGVWDFDSPDILGQSVAGQFFIEPEFGNAEKVSFSVRAGFGISYQNRPYDPIQNPDNLSYSTAFTFPLHLGTSLRWSFAERWQTHLSARYNHISNGGIKQPNKGVNWPTLAVGIAYHPKGLKSQTLPKTHWRSLGQPLRRVGLSAFGASKELMDESVHAVLGLEVKYSQQVGRINALTVGTEWLYHGKYPHEARREGSTASARMAGLALGHEFILGRFLFSQQFGAYLLKPQNERSDVYQRYGLTYVLNQKWMLGANLKTHGHVADFLDVRIGYFFGKGAR